MTKRWTDPFPISFFSTLFTLCVLFPATHSASSQTTNSAPFAEVALPDVLQWTASAFAGRLSPLPGRNGVVLTGNMWPASRPPFSFVYDGKPSETFFASWKREIRKREFPDHTEYHIEWDDPQTGLKVTALVSAFHDFPAVEWFLRFENAGTNDTPILEKVQALDITLNTSPAQNLLLDQINGDDASTNSYVPSERGLKPGQSVALAPVGGRPSNGTFPFFNLQQGACGFFTAIGWTGQWAASVRRNEAGATHLQAGMELTHLSLHPGESIRTPRILLLPWSGDRLEAQNEFRRLLLAHYLPKLGGQPAQFAFAAQTFMEFARGARPNWATEAG